MAELNDNAIEFFSDSKTAWVTFSKKKFVNKIRKYAEERSDVEIISDNNDGSIYAKIPVSWVKISPPRSREMSEEEKARAAERLRNARKNKTT